MALRTAPSVVSVLTDGQGYGDRNPRHILIGPDGSGRAPGIIGLTPSWRPAGWVA